MKTAGRLDRRHRPPTARAGAAACDRSGVLRFLAVFLGCVIVYYALTLVPWVDRHLLYPVLELTAHSASALLNLIGAATSVRGVVVQGADFAVAVRRGCDPLEPILLFSAAVLAFPAPLKFKLGGWLLGAPLLFALNQVRITSLFLAGRARLSWFYPLHQEWWPALFIFAAVVLWLVWLRCVRVRLTPRPV